MKQVSVFITLQSKHSLDLTHGQKMSRVDFILLLGENAN